MTLFEGKWLTRYHVDYGTEDQKYYDINPSIVYSKNFILDYVEKIKLRICALGYYIAKINGKLITDDVLNNEWTYYSECMYYDEYDITSLLHIGENTIEVELGNGMYNPFPLNFFAKHNLRKNIKDIGEPKFVLQIFTQKDVLIKTDKSWDAKTGDRKFNNLYMGETVDSKFEGKEIKFKAVPLSKRDEKKFSLSNIPKIKEFAAIKNSEIEKVNSDHYIFDFGQTISGFLKVSIKSNSEKVVKFRFCESKLDGKLNYNSSFAGGIGCVPGASGGLGAPEKVYEEDNWKIYPGNNYFKNKFTYHSFRYVEIWGCNKDDITKIEAIPVHTDLAQIGFYDSDNAFLKKLYEVGIKTRLNNVHGIFEDCARERLQYGGDIVTLLTAMLYTFDLSRFNKKVFNDFKFGQTSNGGIPETAPYMGIESQGTGRGEGPLLWQLVLPYLAYKNYQFYGDREFLKYSFSTIKKQYEYLMRWNIADLAERCIGDHGSPIINSFYESTPDKIFVGYCTILIFNSLYLKICSELGRPTKLVKEKDTEIRSRINELYLNDDGSYGQKTQTSFAFALSLKLGDREKLKNGLLEKIKEDKGLFTSGIFGQSLLYTQLHLLNCDDLVLNWLTQDSSIGFKQMLASGDQVLKEKLRHNEAADSANHAMFSSYLKWYYEALGGISISKDAIGFSKVLIDPFLTNELPMTKVKMNTIYGIIETKTEIRDKNYKYTVVIPKEIEYELGPKILSYSLKKEDLKTKIKLTFNKLVKN